MTENIQILNNSGISLTSKGLAHFKFNDTNKQYIVYTLDEQENGLVKIYIGYENAQENDLGITDIESANITELIKKMATNKDFSSIATILPLTENLYHIHDKVKGVRIPIGALNNIIAVQQRGETQIINNNDNSIIKENVFFDPSVNSNEKNEQESVVEPSVFSSNKQPIYQGINQDKTIEMNTVDYVNKTLETNGIIQNNTVESTIDESKIISDEEAKAAITAVEAAQLTIKENIGIIKEFIKQQRNKEVPKTIGSTIDMNNETKEETDAPRYDVVNNLELAPQPEVSENVLSSESNLSGNILDTSVNQISVGGDASSVDTSVSIPQVDLSQPASPQPSTQTSLSEQPLPAATPIPNEPQTEMIDTRTMIPQQSVQNMNLNSLVTEEGSETKVLDTTNMSMIGSKNNIPQIEEQVFNDQLPRSMVPGLPVTESQNSIGLISEEQNNQNNTGYQGVSNETVDIQIPDVGVDSQTSLAPQILNNSENVNDISVASTGSLGNPQQQGNSGSITGEEFAIPQIDMSVSTIDQSSAPVVMPDGQSQDNNQGLILTPDAFDAFKEAA